MREPLTSVLQPDETQQGGLLEARDALAQMSGAAVSPELARLLSDALALQARRQQNAIKGAMGQKAAAERRHREWLMRAHQLIASRSRPFVSYRDLARAVAATLQQESSEETIRKRLADAGLLKQK